MTSVTATTSQQQTPAFRLLQALAQYTSKADVFTLAAAFQHKMPGPNFSKLSEKLCQCMTRQAHSACRELGMRFHPTMGAMSVEKSKGDAAPDSTCEEEDYILEDMKRHTDEFHDVSR